jgi:iron complex transport system ATP-binding protein
MIELRKVDFSYSENKVLAGVSATFPFGGLHGVFGPNGSGKSSLLKIITGELRPDAGEVSPTYSCPLQRARSLTFVEQEIPARIPLSVREVVWLGRYPWKRDSSGNEAAEQALKTLKLSGIADKPYNQLSGGERQRVMLARALAQDTGILILDEPASSLDIRYQNFLYELLQELSAFGKCVIMVSHDFFIAPRYLNTALLMNEGRIHAAGSPDKVLSPENIQDVFRCKIG